VAASASWEASSRGRETRSTPRSCPGASWWPSPCWLPRSEPSPRPACGSSSRPGPLARWLGSPAPQVHRLLLPPASRTPPDTGKGTGGYAMGLRGPESGGSSPAPPTRSSWSSRRRRMTALISTVETTPARVSEVRLIHRVPHASPPSSSPGAGASRISFAPPPR